MKPKCVSRERMNTIQPALAASNALAKSLSEKTLGKRRYKDYRNALAGRPSNLSLVESRKLKQISVSDRRTMLFAEEVRNEIVEGFQRMVWRIACSVAPRYGYDKEDAFGQGIFYLIDAIYGYNLSSIRFMTYAYSVVLRELERYALMHCGSLTSTSSDFVDLRRAWIGAEENLLQEGKRATLHNVAEHLGLSQAMTWQMMGACALVESRAMTERSGFDDDANGDISWQAWNDPGFESVLDADLIQNALQNSSPLEKATVHGILQGLNMAQIGIRQKVTREAVRKALKRFGEKILRKTYRNAA